MRSGLLALIVGCGSPAFVPVVQPVVHDEPVAPAIVMPIQAEQQYAALDPHDPRLARACDELAYLVAHGGTATNNVATAVLRMHGIVNPPQTVLVGAVGDALDAKLGEDFYRPNALVGKGAFERTAVEVLIFLPKMRIATIPRATETGVELLVTLDPALDDPHITVADATESFHPGLAIGDDHVVHATVPCGAQPSERYITIEATDPHTGAMPLVIFPIYCKLQAPTSLVAEPLSNVAGFNDLAGRLTAILNRERAAVALPPLRHDARIETAARAYAQDRSENRQTDLNVVMRDAGLLGPAMNWTTFHVDSLESAVNRIVNSSEELDKLRDVSRTDIGVGAKRVADGWWISIVYVTIPPPIDTESEARRIANAIRWVQEHELDRRTQVDLYANIIATRYAQGLARGWSADDLYARAYGAMIDHAEVRCEIAIDRRVELAGLDLGKLINKHKFHHVGVGIAQSPRNSPLAGTIWLVVFFY
jgi:Cysteine-rich secretory protein family